MPLFFGNPSSLSTSASLGWSDAMFVREAANTVALRNSTNAQIFEVYGTADAGLVNYRRLRTTMTTGGAVTIAAEGLGTGVSGNSLEFVVNGTTGLTITSSGAVFGAGVAAATGAYFYWPSSSGLSAPVNGTILAVSSGNTDTDFFLKLGVNTSAACGIKRVGTELRVRLNDDSAYTFITGKLRTDTNYAAGTFTATGYLTVYDLAGTAYRIPCAV